MVQHVQVHRIHPSETVPNTAWHDKLVSLVERMLELHDPLRLSATSPKSQGAGFRGGRTPQELAMLKREIEPSADERIKPSSLRMAGRVIFPMRRF
jgi:hypothetical protein